MAHKKRSQELIQLAVKLYEELKSTQKVARKLGLGSTTIHRILKDAGVTMPSRFDPIVQERKKSLHGDLAKQAANDYANGMSMTDLMNKYNVGRWAIKTAVKDNGGVIRPVGGKFRQFTEEDKDEIRRLYCDEYWSQEQLGAKFHSNQCTISRLLRELDVKVYPQRASGSDHGSWNGGRVKIGEYVAVYVYKDDPLFCMAHQTGYVLEHRLVMARALGRPLGQHETVHHIDGNKENNLLDNLQLRFGKHGKGITLKCCDCGSNNIITTEI